MSTLIKNTQKKNDFEQAIIFKNKVWFLCDEFFSAFSKADLSNIFDVCYSSMIDCSAVNIEKKMKKTLHELDANKTFELNKRINHFLKICGDALIVIFNFFFQICVNFEYHSRKYHKNDTTILKKSNKNCYNTMKTWWSIVFVSTINKLLKTIMNHKLFYFMTRYNWLFIS